MGIIAFLCNLLSSVGFLCSSIYYELSMLRWVLNCLIDYWKEYWKFWWYFELLIYDFIWTFQKILKLQNFNSPSSFLIQFTQESRTDTFYLKTHSKSISGFPNVLFRFILLNAFLCLITNWHVLTSILRSMLEDPFEKNLAWFSMVKELGIFLYFCTVRFLG